MDLNLNLHQSPDQEVLTVLAYFNYFNYPLKQEEILLYCSIAIGPEVLQQSLTRLEEGGYLYRRQDYYGYQPLDRSISNREEGAGRFYALQQRIERSARRIRLFPFIQLIGLSGSLSKGYAGAQADIDFFIVTDTNRLWIARTLLHLFKKMAFIKQAQHWYCMNYFIDDTALCLEEQNYYTAIEMVTLKPLYNADSSYERLLEANKIWILRELPNWRMPVTAVSDKRPKGLLQRFFGLCGTDGLNKLLMQLTNLKWRYKWKRKHYPDEDYDLAFKTRINVSKNHYHNYQKKMLQYLRSMTEEQTGV